MLRILLGIPLTLFAIHGQSGALAQTTGTCEPGTAQEELDVGRVRASIYNTGNLFRDINGGFYEVPKDSSAHAIFSTSLWLGARVNGELRAAINHFYESELWPGPLDENGDPPADCTPYDRIFNVYRSDIESLDAGGTATEDIRDWPWELGALVRDGDGNPGNYDVAAGDRPRVLGDQTAWWVMNDAGNVHERSKTAPLGVELRVTAFGFEEVFSNAWPEYATFYLIDVVNKSPARLDSLYFGSFVDADVGYGSDDRVGCDSLLGLGYAYNADDFDREYGNRPPAIGYTMIAASEATDDGIDNDFDGATDEPGERRQTTSCLELRKSSGFPPLGEYPQSAEGYYNLLQGLGSDGMPITYGSYGSDYSASPTTFMYTADPPEFWSADQIEPGGPSSRFAEIRFLVGLGPLRLDSGDSERILMSILFAREGDRHQSVQRLKVIARNALNLGSWLLDDVDSVSIAEPPTPEGPAAYGLGHYPSPGSGQVFVRYNIPVLAPVRITLFDVLGREVLRIVNAPRAPGEYEEVVVVSHLASGVYYYVLETKGYSFPARTLVVVR
ncbi:MAG: T9SS type A sorting domain-containing protein [Rhodothermales bacterium]|nr:T9SS type A sorting domain-containing protein [Rhodothermales bacterium]